MNKRGVVAVAAAAALVLAPCVVGEAGLKIKLPKKASLKISPPSKPSGPSGGTVGQVLTFTTKGTDPLNAHLFKFQWGDGTESNWGKRNESGCSHAYRRPGTYSVRAKEKCPLGLFETGWSAPKTVVITAPAGAAAPSR